MAMNIKVIGSEVRQMFGSIAHRYDLANSVLSFGTHHCWRRSLVRLAPERQNGVALDLCTGTGDLVPLLERRFGSCIGVDFCFPMMFEGKKKFSLSGFLPPRFVQGDALQLPFADRTIDVLSVAFGVRNLENLEAGLAEMRRVLKPGGHLLILEFGQPRNPIFGALFGFYSRYIMPLIGGLLTGNRAAYTYLPRTSRSFPCGEAFKEILNAAGYEHVRFQPLSLGIAYQYHATRP